MVIDDTVSLQALLYLTAKHAGLDLPFEPDWRKITRWSAWAGLSKKEGMVLPWALSVDSLPPSFPSDLKERGLRTVERTQANREKHWQVLKEVQKSYGNSFCLLKGYAIWILHPQWAAARTMADADIFIRPAELERFDAFTSEKGFERIKPFLTRPYHTELALIS